MTDTIGATSDEYDVSKLLLPALRQYQQNDHDDLVAVYDYAETQKIVLELLKDLKNILELAESAVEISKSAIDACKT